MYSSRDRRGSGRSLLPVGTGGVAQPAVPGPPAVPPESLPVPPTVPPTPGDDAGSPTWAPLSRTSPVIVPVQATLLRPRARPRLLTDRYPFIARVRTATGHGQVKRSAAFAGRRARIRRHEIIPGQKPR